MAAKFSRERSSPAQSLLTGGIEINRANDIAEEDRLQWRHLLHVGTRQYRTIGVMEKLGGDRAQKEAPESTVPMRRHHNQIHMLLVGEFSDSASDIPVQQQPPDRHVLELLCATLIEKALRFSTRV